MSEVPTDTVPCRLCGTLVVRDATVCPSCGSKEPWIPDEPTINPRVISLAMCGVGIVLVGLLFFVSGLLMFGPPAESGGARRFFRRLAGGAVDPDAPDR